MPAKKKSNTNLTSNKKAQSMQPAKKKSVNSGKEYLAVDKKVNARIQKTTGKGKWGPGTTSLSNQQHMRRNRKMYDAYGIAYGGDSYGLLPSPKKKK